MTGNRQSLRSRLVDRYRFQWREQLVKVVKVRDREDRYSFRCESDLEVWRAETLTEKEAGTVAWIRERVGPGDVFYDVGANIGIYSVLAARRVGTEGRVYSFEPHVPNFASLLQNIGLNELYDRIVPLCCALHDREGMFDFNYQSNVPGSSMSQLGAVVDGYERPFRPVITEYKFALPLDRLIRDQAIRPPNHVKIDVDGNEMLVLKGMAELLASPYRPQSLQVEINARYKHDLYQFLDGRGYEQYGRHFTRSGQAQLDGGKNPDEIAHNALFRPRTG